MIICAVSAGGFITYIVQGLYDWSAPWIPVLICSLNLALFAEILPQFIIPRNPIVWGYACWPLVWFCMFITAIISAPLSLLLDYFAGSKTDMLAVPELAALIQYAQKHHKIASDAATIMWDALALDQRQIGGYKSASTTAESEKDLENGEQQQTTPPPGSIITPWSTVKTVHIDDPIDDDFINKVKHWRFSRIPVVGNSEIFGYFHVKVRTYPNSHCSASMYNTVWWNQPSQFNSANCRVESSRWVNKVCQRLANCRSANRS